MRENKLTPGKNLRWESSRMMLPEHVEALMKEQKNLEKVERPHLSEDKLQKIQQILLSVIKTHEFVELSYYRYGFIKQKICTIAKLDPFEKIVQVYDGFGMGYRILFSDVVGVCVIPINNNS
ncbi:YolD-like family protein [Sporolactobacillus sp. KGMB 08714]|uniref:YolD-like family protein n=1 Tax=Sporolactobacillus sp. KGMB 08714 TaxID=3064704 RepID=UPI002FBD528F